MTRYEYLLDNGPSQPETETFPITDAEGYILRYEEFNLRELYEDAKNGLIEITDRLYLRLAKMFETN